MQNYTFRTIIEPDENDTFHGYAPALPGCHTWGDTLQEVKANLDEAVELYVAFLIDQGEPVPSEVGLESYVTVSEQNLKALPA